MPSSGHSREQQIAYTREAGGFASPRALSPQIGSTGARALSEASGISVVKWNVSYGKGERTKVIKPSYLQHMDIMYI